jgi:uncharacterized protein (UPF0264 family)
VRDEGAPQSQVAEPHRPEPTPGHVAPQALVSVRTVQEARRVAAAGVRLIDLKEPRHGALGALAPQRLREITAALRAEGCRAEISATLGDLPPGAVADTLHAARAVAGCGVDVVKVGVWPGPAAQRLLDELRRWAQGDGRHVVPVLIADRGWDESLMAGACEAGFHAVMVDTQDKQAGSVLGRLPLTALRRLVGQARGSGCRAGLAGALRLADVPLLRELAPDFAGFRSAVCRGERGGDLCPQRLARLLQALGGGSPSLRADAPPARHPAG